jgi:hypothetical protein
MRFFGIPNGVSQSELKNNVPYSVGKNLNRK